jgi:tetratricopeptide (TPR) repeat protein
MNMRLAGAATLCAAAVFLGSSTTLHAETTEELVTNGEVFDKQFNPREALKCYLPAEKLEPKNVDILLRIARQYRHLLADAATKEEKVRLGKIALNYSQRAAALAPDEAEAQLSVAISYGKLVPFLGKKEQVETSPRIKSAVDKTLRLDPQNDLAWHILGRWHRNLAEISGLKRVVASALYGGLPKGSLAEAESALRKAIALNPDRLIHYIELGRIYANMGRKADARKYIEKGLAMPEVEKDDAEMKARGREVLEKLR